jgi:CheY-like chemotaxis protein
MLLVNDEVFLLMAYTKLAQSKFQIETAENGLQALQIVGRFPPGYFDVIILDINMPIMDGYQACNLISKY